MEWMGITKGNAKVGQVIKKTYEWADDNNQTDVEVIRNHARKIIDSWKIN